MNTMADGARDRLVAQIGEALFGQPGLTLMELAEKVKQHDLSLDRTIGERDRYHDVADDLAGHIAAITGVDIGEHSSANCPWQNAIEAAEEYQPVQPSPAGQREYVQGSDELRARTEGERAAYLEGLEEGKLIAARQPVGPKFYTEDGPCWWHNGKAYIVTVDEDNLQLSVMDGVHCEFIGDARPFRVPAQAVDLGQFRQPLESWKRKRERSLRNAIEAGKGNELVAGLRRNLEEADRLLALIDSKAVGK
ncbi:MAG TPA: hypothetical protein DCP40_08920 [Stenotrophomonas sp.]|nr:hypothetical protein [Stenotrophomonas sp.]